jgi:hypothetical protein
LIEPPARLTPVRTSGDARFEPRFSEAGLAPALRPIRARLEELEAENRALRERLAEKPN